MPIYEYRCTNCNHTFDELVSSSNGNEKIECPKCGEKEAQKMMSSFASGGGSTKASSNSGCGVGGFT